MKQKKYKHIINTLNVKNQPYSPPRQSIPPRPPYEREHIAHGNRLKKQLQELKNLPVELKEEAAEVGLQSTVRVQLTVSSAPGVDLPLDMLSSHGVEILTIKTLESKDENTVKEVTVAVPADNFLSFEQRIEEYLTKSTKSGAPLRQALFNNIEEIRAAVLHNLWTDMLSISDVDWEECIWLEAWLPTGEGRSSRLEDFKKICEKAEIEYSEETLEFAERTVILINSSLATLQNSPLLLSTLAELRRSRDTAEFFDALPVDEQHDWVGDLLSRANVRQDEVVPYVSIIDTGVNIGNPLLSPFSTQDDLYAVKANWSLADMDGHGTEMAGVAIWGDNLQDLLASNEKKSINHRFESLKLLGRDANDDSNLWGAMTANLVAQAEIAHPDRLRIFSMAITSSEESHRGLATSWSSAVDQLVSDSLNAYHNPRLFMISAGNYRGGFRSQSCYPKANKQSSIEEPAQAYNALTVGAYTEKAIIEGDNISEDSKPLAKSGELSPWSTTSTDWEARAPYKPDVLFEGGNAIVDIYGASQLPSLSLLTANYDFLRSVFTTTNATSAATALAAKFAAEVYAQYPELWPETIRALMVHSAEWTDEMLLQFCKNSKPSNKAEAAKLLRILGHGVPCLDKALWSRQNSVVLVREGELQPYKREGSQNPKFNEMTLYELPWPVETLRELGEETVKLTVTLSYFIEPNPSSRNVSTQYSYASHQLRFDMKRATESRDDFLRRINREYESDSESSPSQSEDGHWRFGIKARHRGSIHKDVWEGMAVELAERELLVVYPVTGWWKTRKKLERYNKKVRYSLVCSIETESEDIDIYTPILNKVETPVSVEISI